MTRKDLSQLDPGGVLKDSHDFDAHSLRVINGISEVPSDYSRVELTYNSKNSVTDAKFFKGDLPQEVEITFKDDTLSNLNNTYFQLYSENNEELYHIWYNVSGLGTDPAPSGSTGLEIEIQANDPAEVVSLATKLVLEKIKAFKIERVARKLIITNIKSGIANDPVDNGTGFVFNVIQQGSETLIKDINIPFDSKTRYIYNTQEKKFEIESIGGDISIDADSGDNVAISRHANPREILDEVNKLPGDLSTSTYTNIFTHTAAENLRVRAIKIKADTFGTFRLKVNNILKDYYLTSPMKRNVRFYFLEDLDALNGQDIEIDFIPVRIQNVSTYNFFMRIEAYVD